VTAKGHEDQSSLLRTAAVDAADRSRGQTAHSKMIIDACKPFDRRDTFAPVSALTADEAQALAAKWGAALRG
jgi:hypothetical protein